MEAYEYLSQHLQRDMTYDIRLENYVYHHERMEKHEKYACFPPRYAIELHQKINRYAPLYAAKWGSNRPTHAVDLPCNADDHVRRCAEDQIQSPAARSLEQPAGVGSSSSGLGGWQWQSRRASSSQSHHGGHVADLTLRMWGVLDDSMEVRKALTNIGTDVGAATTTTNNTNTNTTNTNTNTNNAPGGE